MTLADLQARIYRRLGEDPANPQWWTLDETRNALNWSQRFFVLLTLCLEDRRLLDLTPGQPYYHMLSEPSFTDWFAPLRVRVSNNPDSGADSTWGNFLPPTMPNAQILTPPSYNTQPKVRPSRLADFDALSDTWTTDTGIPTRYAHLKADLMVFNRTPAVAATVSLLVTCAIQPQPLVLPADVPAIPETDHHALADMATVFLRMKDGGQEMNKSKSLMESFLAVVKRRAAEVRARSIAQQYDLVPFEIERFDFSRMWGKRQDLAPTRQKEAM